MVQDFHGALVVANLVLGKSDLGAGAFAKDLCELIVVDHLFFNVGCYLIFLIFYCLLSEFVGNERDYEVHRVGPRSLN